MIVDSHCHFTSFPPQEIKKIIDCRQDYIFIDSSINYKSTQQSLALSQEYPFIYTSAGFHPFWVKEYSADTIAIYEELICKNKKVAAIGEVGLDYKAEVSLSRQEAVFRQFIELAKKHKLPLLIHNRFDPQFISESKPPVFSILDDFFSDYEKVIFHCFSYGKELLEKILDKKGIVSFSLNILRGKKSIVSSLKMCPLDSLIFETDSPYMKINNQPSTPQNIKEVYSFAAKIKGIEEEKLEQIVYSNIQRIFGLGI